MKLPIRSSIPIAVERKGVLLRTELLPTLVTARLTAVIEAVHPQKAMWTHHCSATVKKEVLTPAAGCLEPENLR